MVHEFSQGLPPSEVWNSYHNGKRVQGYTAALS